MIPTLCHQAAGLNRRIRAAALALAASAALPLLGGCIDSAVDVPAESLPADIRQVFDQPRYQGAAWGLRVVDLDTGELVYDLHSDRPYLIGSVRKMFSVGLALQALGPDHRFRTPVHRQGSVDAAGVLAGDLILVAQGDLSMGGRTLPDGSYAITNFDHNEANALGGAELTTPDPLAGYRALAAQVAAAGIRRVTGEVVIDDRLFQPFNFRGEFEVRPIFVNDDVIDVTATPATPGTAATVDWRPKSAAFTVAANVNSGTGGSAFAFALAPELPACIGSTPCGGTVTGSIPVDYVPPFTNAFPVVRNFRITEPANYARTVFIEALQQAGVTVDAAPVEANPVAVLPARGSYAAATRVAQLVSPPYEDYARHILKVSYNIGADTSLMLYGLTQGVDTQAGALSAERTALAADYGIAPADLHFVDGSGGADSSATNQAVIQWLRALDQRPVARVFHDALPSLGVDGSLASLVKFKADTSLAGAAGQVYAKTGTFVEGTATGAILKAQTMGGYITARSGRRLAYMLAVNDAGEIASIADVFTVFEDQGLVSAMLWKHQ